MALDCCVGAGDAGQTTEYAGPDSASPYLAGGTAKSLGSCEVK